MSIKDNNPLAAQRMKVVHTYHDVSGHNKTVGASSTTVVGVTAAAIADAVGAIQLSNVGDGVLYIEPAGSAGPDSFPVPPGGCHTLYGTAAEIRLAQIYASPSTVVGFMYREVYQ